MRQVLPSQTAFMSATKREVTRPVGPKITPSHRIGPFSSRLMSKAGPLPA